MGWEAGDAEGGWVASFSAYICSTSDVPFYHLTYLVYLLVIHEHMTLPRDKLCLTFDFRHIFVAQEMSSSIIQPI